ncbi:MAG: DUF2244 domain-containing protein [Pseudomonadales bacterium]|jgi:uncharacterized membrane protein
MITSNFDTDARAGCIILEPNRSWTWRANTLFVATLMVISVTIAIAFTAQGYWVVLPFTALELSVLTACLYYCVRRTHLKEVLTFRPESVVLERGVLRPERRHEFERYFARFFVRPAKHPWYQKRIALRCRDEEVEIGRFLTSEEVDALVPVLRRMINQLDTLPVGDIRSRQ